MNRIITITTGVVQLVLVFILVLSNVAFEKPISTEFNDSDLTTIDGVVDQLYSSLSGKAGTRDWEQFRLLHHKDAQVAPLQISSGGQFVVAVMSVEEFVNSAKPFFKTRDFYENELFRKVDQFGNIAQVFSTYETVAVQGEESKFQRGINSIQLVFQQNRWWILHATWQPATASLPIPTEYLGQ